jgi:DNA-binding NtrC family response regulator
MSKERLLILDPEENTQWTLKALLEGEGFSVIATASIDQALNTFKENDLIGLITEYRIGHSSTLNIIREFKRDFPGAYVLMLSNQDTLENEYEEIIDAGIDDFFQKPISFKKVLVHLKKGLKHRLNEVLEKKQAAGPEAIVLDSTVPEGAKIQPVV